MHVQQILKNLGLSDNQSRIYLAALETGLASAQDIADKANLKRTTTYSVLDTLVHKGFILKTQKEGKNRFVAESPEKLVDIFASYQQQLKNALPQLSAIYNTKHTKPKVLFFEGKLGLKKIYYDTIEEKPKVILEWNTAEIFEVFPDFSTEYVNMRKMRNIKARRIAPNVQKMRLHQNKDKDELSITRLLPINQYNIPVEINIYNNKVAFISYNDKIGLIIESQAIAEAMQQIYELSWQRAEQISN